MTQIDQIIADALAGLPETDVAILAREVVRLRDARTVVVPEPTRKQWIAEVLDPAASEGAPFATIRYATQWFRKNARAIPADRVLGETEVKVPGSCVWSKVDLEDERNWSTTCQHVWSFEDGGPSENSASFCPICGGQIEIEPDSGSNQGGSAT